MDYENLYKNALERARVWKEKSGMPADKQGILDDIFPELAESEDEKVRKALIEMVHDATGDSLWVAYNVHKEEALAWLEKQGEQKSIEWGEDDEEMLRSIIATCELAEADRDSSPARHLLEMQLNWLKSLKPQSHWKPSDEQMDALKHYVDTTMDGDIDLLYQDLKELREDKL